MPGGTRRIPRSVRSTSISPPVISSFANEPCGQRYAALGAAVPTLPALEQPAAPKHFPFPNTQVEDDLFFECLNCFFMVTAAGLQFLHMYRTVWWLPYSYTNQTVNFYLIDHHLVIFITFILCRRLLYMLGCHVLETILPEKALNIWCYAFRSILFGMMTVILSMSAYHVLQNHQLEKILYLCYPLCVYLLLFGFNVHPFFEFVNWSPVARPPLHACTSNAGDIRNEVEYLITNFNNRMKEILFNAILNAYYAGFIPCCFAEPALHYDRTWAGQHTLFILESGFVSLSVHFLSLRYCDILHRSALHLGTWDKIDTGRTMLLVNNTWKEDVLWPYGALVRHGRDIWRAQGDCNSSEPGNAGLKRFYYIFKNPTNMLSVKLLVHILMVVYQLVQLVRSSVWYNIISLTLVLSFNYYVLYKICRDYLVSYKIYTDERDLHKKINMR